MGVHGKEKTPPGVTRQIRKLGWTVLRLWECALSRKRQARTMSRLRRALGK